MPDPEIKEWISLFKDILLGLTALVTMALAVYGVRAWKRDLVGKEVYSATRSLVKESHLLTRAARKLREPINSYERRSFSDKEVEHTTKNERWRLSEAAAYKYRVEVFAKEIERYEEARLDLRVLVGSKVYEGFMPFGALITDSINIVNGYLDLIEDNNKTILPDSEEVLASQKALYPSLNLDDEISQRIADARKKGEISLLAYLHRKSIYG